MCDNFMLAWTVWGLPVFLLPIYSEKYIYECSRAVFQNHFKNGLRTTHGNPCSCHSQPTTKCIDTVAILILVSYQSQLLSSPFPVASRIRRAAGSGLVFHLKLCICICSLGLSTKPSIQVQPIPTNSMRSGKKLLSNRKRAHTLQCFICLTINTRRYILYFVVSSFTIEVSLIEKRTYNSVTTYCVRRLDQPLSKISIRAQVFKNASKV